MPSRVQGGSVVTPTSALTFPHQMEILEFPTAPGEDPMHICGGALLAAQLSFFSCNNQGDSFLQ